MQHTAAAHSSPVKSRLAAVLLLAGLVAAGCSSGGSSAHSSALVGTKLQQDCTTVSNVLSDGPDPDADSLGYAQAQILPLQQTKVSEADLRDVIKNLATAYQNFVSTSGRSAAASQVSSAVTALNKICPGAAQ